ncbi:hypothetical protein GCM10027176_77030 [Actinoallomurus bryophytorum]|uniref:Uncharacterized protein n=1 Tax=Actinoallomurus bryophytorum TaxID=1490222 RepID=A0A543C104_9ACTN|nr:hypothetical protein [Actinoallomurus bryophytorum]TQL90757.1 hypothetical protein FB559_8070 [Actinoallomurus bryophytorum]
MYRIFTSRALVESHYWYALGLVTGAATAGSLVTSSALGALVGSVVLLLALAFLWFPIRVLVVSSGELRLRTAELSARRRRVSLARIDWRDVHEMFVASREGAATLVVGRWVRPPRALFPEARLDAVGVELPPGYDHGLLLDAIGQAAPHVPVHEMTLAELLTRTQRPYTLRAPQVRGRLGGFAAGCAAAAAAITGDHYGLNAGALFIILAGVAVTLGTPALEIGPHGLRVRRWDPWGTGWSAVTSVDVRDLGERVEIEVTTSSGRTMTRRLPRARVDLETLEATLRAYAPPQAVKVS